MLFADEVTTSAVLVWLGPVLAVVGTTITSFFAYLTVRAKLRFDAEMVELKATIRQLTSDVADCNSDRALLKLKCAQLERDREETKAKCELLEIRCEQQQVQIDELIKAKPLSP